MPSKAVIQNRRGSNLPNLWTCSASRRVEFAAEKKLIMCLLLSSSPVLAQEMPGMDMGKDGTAMHSALGGYGMNRDSSGTSWQPDLGPAMGRMDMEGDWMLMSRLALTGVYDYQSGPRGDQMPFLAGMAMGMAQKDFGDNSLGFRAMLSPDRLMGR